MLPTEIVSILDNARELDRIRKDLEDVIVEINKMHKKLQTSPDLVEKPGDASLSKLKSLYTQAKDFSENEISVSNELLSQLDVLLSSGPSGQQRRRIVGDEHKRKRMKADSDVSRLPPIMKSQIEACASLKNEQVAAKVTMDNADKDEWFVVKVIHFDRESKEFEVLDEEPGDDEESGDQRKYKLPMSCIIPFSKRNDPASAPDFPTGRHVLAVYPGTTALYKATVVGPPRKRKTDDYLLEFDDDEEDGALPQRMVPFYSVVALPEGHRK